MGSVLRIPKIRRYSNQQIQGNTVLQTNQSCASQYRVVLWLGLVMAYKTSENWK